VQAQSDALIEKVRTAVTDRTGQYRIEELRPGTYTVTFGRDGFSPQQREGVEIAGAFTAIVNVVLSLGGFSEAVSVTVDSAAVDVRNPGADTTLRGDLIRSIPTVRSYNALVVLIPGIATNANDIVMGTSTTQFPLHGGRSNEGRLS